MDADPNLPVLLDADSAAPLEPEPTSVYEVGSRVQEYQRCLEAVVRAEKALREAQDDAQTSHNRLNGCARACPAIDITQPTIMRIAYRYWKITWTEQSFLRFGHTPAITIEPVEILGA